MPAFQGHECDSGQQRNWEKEMHGQTIWALTLALTLSAALLDWRSRRIPNWLTVPGLFLGVAVHAALSGWHGALFAIEGAGLALLLLLTPVLMRLLGAGDWKLMGAVGALMGPVLVLVILFGSILVSGLMAIVQMTRSHRVVETLRNMVVLIRGVFAFGLQANAQASLDTPHSLKLPFGVAVAMATVICFCAATWIV
jgi:prepilin peptidase CpaA